MIKDKLGDYRKKAYLDDFVLTKFLDFEEQMEIYGVNDGNLSIHLFGGYESSERKRAVITRLSKDIYPSFYQIAILESTFDERYSEITHRHVLGTIMHLGIERNTFGDIIVSDQKIVIFVSKDIKDYIIKNLKEINHQRMDFKEVKTFILPEKKEMVLSITVPSLRLDAIIARSINVGRNEATLLIESAKVFINHQEVTNITKQVKESDLISIRKYGRVKILEIIGKTKKERIALKIEINR